MKRPPAPAWLKAAVVGTLVLLSGCTHGAPTALGPTGGPTGAVIGGIEPCIGISRLPVHFVSGTIVALRGSERIEPVAPGEYRSVLPPTEVAIRTVSDRQQYHFSLTPGHYVLHVVRSPSASELPIIGVTVEAHHTVRANMPDECK